MCKVTVRELVSPSSPAAAVAAGASLEAMCPVIEVELYRVREGRGGYRSEKQAIEF